MSVWAKLSPQTAKLQLGGDLAGAPGRRLQRPLRNRGCHELDGDRWRFDARITYGDVDVTLPVVVPILWAGDVPMIRLVDVEIPGLGSEFGATVLFDGDRYAGTWDHGEVGGFMFGRVVRE